MRKLTDIYARLNPSYVKVLYALVALGALMMGIGAEEGWPAP